MASADPVLDPTGISLTEFDPNPEPPPKGMSEEDLLAIVRGELQVSIGFVEGTPEARRADLLKRYLGEPYGNEQEGYSKVVSRDVYEVVEWALPQLLETFTSGDRVARFQAFGPEDEAEAEQQTDMVNHVFLRENNGFLILHTLFKDALIQELGAVKFWWEISHKIESDFYTGLTQDQIAILMQKPNTKITAGQPSAGLPGLYDVEVTTANPVGCLVVDNIPPEEFFYSPDARTLKGARCVGHCIKTTASKLIEMGYDPEVVAGLHGDGRGALTQGDLARQLREDSGTANFARNLRDDAMREIDLVEASIYVDFDGDGVAELRKICCAGNTADVYQILSNEPQMVRPFAVLSPILMPHRMAGISLAETVEDIQLEHTAIERAYLNGLNIGLRPRTITLGDATNGAFANMDELLSAIPGGNVTEYVPNAIRPFPFVDITPQALSGLEYMKGKREERTGITRTWQGLEAPNALNDTARGMAMLTQSAGKRLAMIARIFAETGVKDLFNGMAAMLKIHQDVPKVMRLRGGWVTVDPTTWKNSYDTIVEVGLGYNDRQQGIANAQQVLALQREVGAILPFMVGPPNVWNALAELLKNMGFKNAERFFMDPSKTEPAPPEPSDNDKKLEMERYLKERELEVRELDIRLTDDRERELGQLQVQSDSAKQPDPVAPPAVNIDISKTVAESMAPMVAEIQAMRGDMTRPRRIVRDDQGRIVGAE